MRSLQLAMAAPPLPLFFTFMKRSCMPPPHTLLQSVQLLQGCILQPVPGEKSRRQRRVSSLHTQQPLATCLLVQIQRGFGREKNILLLHLSRFFSGICTFLEIFFFLATFYFYSGSICTFELLPSKNMLLTFVFKSYKFFWNINIKMHYKSSLALGHCSEAQQETKIKM